MQLPKTRVHHRVFETRPATVESAGVDHLSKNPRRQDCGEASSIPRLLRRERRGLGGPAQVVDNIFK